MDLWPAVFGVISLIMGIIGWYYRDLSHRVDKMETKMDAVPTSSEVRTIIIDKMAPHNVEIQSISRRLDELRGSYRDLSKKLDTLISICSTMNDKK